jgi:hypothetical protein
VTPALMVAPLRYAYCTGLRSSRMIERRCVEDVTCRILAGGLCPDHVTIARCRARRRATAPLRHRSLQQELGRAADVAVGEGTTHVWASPHFIRVADLHRAIDIAPHRAA